jgi:hypothetical protein
MRQGKLTSTDFQGFMERGCESVAPAASDVLAALGQPAPVRVA